MIEQGMTMRLSDNGVRSSFTHEMVCFAMMAWPADFICTVMDCAHLQPGMTVERGDNTNRRQSVSKGPAWH